MNATIQGGRLQGLMDRVVAAGFALHDVSLRGEVALLPAGGRDHWTGKRVEVFAPVATRLTLVTGAGEVIGAARYEADGVTVGDEHPHSIKEQPFDAKVVCEGVMAAGDGVEAANEDKGTAGYLMRSLVSEHRTITGQVSAAHEHIEDDPNEIERIRAQRFTLTIGFARMADYLALDEAWLEAICASEEDEAATNARLEELVFRKRMLMHPFADQPCSRELYNRLVVAFRGGKYGVGSDFTHFYAWFLRSQQRFDGDGRIKAEAREEMEQAVGRLMALAVEQSVHKLIHRNFDVHPLHRGEVDGVIDELVRKAADAPA